MDTNPVNIKLNKTHLDKTISDDHANDGRLKLLPFEQNLMADSFIDDVLFVMARGLALERLFFNHLHLYSDPNDTVLVINTTTEDEQYFLEKLKALNPECPPKLITADMLIKDREHIYCTGGVQFITSRILMVDLLTNRIPIDKVAGILVYRAHEILSGFQESFILRLFREKKRHGFVKAFTDNSLAIVADSGLGQLQRLLNLLYIRRVIVLPRFHTEVKACFEENMPVLTQMSIQLETAQRKAQANLRDIIATCVRELKQCTKDFGNKTDELDALASSATLRPTRIEIDLRKRNIPLTDRQQRLLSDLQTLRTLFYKVEDLDPTNALTFISWLRTDKNMLENNSGWLFTQSAATLFSSINALCSVKDTDGNKSITVPPKWSVFCNIIKEISAKLISENSDSPVIVLVSNEQLSRQLIDLIKFGQRRYTWMLARKVVEPSHQDSFALAPQIESLWNPVNVACYDTQVFEKDCQDLRNHFKIVQKEVAKEHRKRNRRINIETDSKQLKLDQFGIQPFSQPREMSKANNDNEKHYKKNVIAKRSPINIMNFQSKPIGLAKISHSTSNVPLCRETLSDGILPEDPLTSFYEHEKNTGRNINNKQIKKVNPEIGQTEINEMEFGADQSNVSLNIDDVCQSTFSAPPFPDEDMDSETECLPQRIFVNEEFEDDRNRETTKELFNKSIAAVARERAERSIHVIDLFENEQAATTKLDKTSLFSAIAPATTFNQSLNSLLVFLELGNRYRLIKCLEALRPKHIVMYSQDIVATRIIETFKALNTEHILELYVLMYEESSEEERYLISIQRESEAIEMLIKEQGLLLVPREFDVTRDNVSELRKFTMQYQHKIDSRTMSNRNYGNNAVDIDEQTHQEIIIDMREFNCELPIVLYKRGINLLPATLEVGDYILSPKICVERKSLDDLTQSLLSGRLFKQVEQMLKNYKKCILLIESTEKYRNRVVRIGAFQGELSRRGREARFLLAMLIRTYPPLIILWSMSPSHSAELFEELKLDQPNPLLDEAIKKKRKPGSAFNNDDVNNFGGN